LMGSVSFPGLPSVPERGKFFLYIVSKIKETLAIQNPTQPTRRGVIWTQLSTIKTTPTHLATNNILPEFNLLFSCSLGRSEALQPLSPLRTVRDRLWRSP
jgi:hypothetical protein